MLPEKMPTYHSIDQAWHGGQNPYRAPPRIRRSFDLLIVFLLSITAWLPHFSLAADEPRGHRFLYVATPGIRNELKYGGHGMLVSDIIDGHKFVRRIRTAGFAEDGQPDNVKGICASAPLQRLYVSTIGALISFDLTTDAIVWEKQYDDCYANPST